MFFKTKNPGKLSMMVIIPALVFGELNSDGIGERGGVETLQVGVS